MMLCFSALDILTFKHKLLILLLCAEVLVKVSVCSGFCTSFADTSFDFEIQTPICKDRHISKLLPPLRRHYRKLPTATNSLHFSSYGIENQNEEIDFNSLFDSSSTTLLAKCLHALLVVSGKIQSNFLSVRLANLYANLGNLSLSRGTFDQIPRKDVYAWNSMISAYVRNGYFREAIDCFYDLLLVTKVQADFYTFPPILKACQTVMDGKKIHCLVLKLGFQWDVFVAASLIHMYSRFGFVGIACSLFDNMPSRDMGSWNAMISGLIQNGNVARSLDVLDEMKLEGTKMDSVTVASILPVCAQLGDISTAAQIHLYVIKHGLEFELFVSNALINMYAKFGKLGHAQKIFQQMFLRDVVSWNSIIAAYEQNDDPVSAHELFVQMQLNGLQPDILTAVSLASVATQSKDYKNSRSVHGFVIRRGWLMKAVVIGNAVMDMYAKLGVIDYAHKVFESITVKDVISWNTLISGYVQNGLASEAIEIYRMMKEFREIKPNQGTWVAILTAYVHVGALQQGMRTHGQLIKTNLLLDVFVGTCLIDLYGKCGSLVDAISLFYLVPRENSVPWNAIISCHGIHGHGEKALKLFREMQDEGVKPDHVTFISLLSACSHSGLVDEGKCFFQLMHEYGIKPGLKHYGCMVDLLGRAGFLNMAYDFIKDMPLQPDASIWGALLGACRIHGNAELGKLASDHLFQVDSENAGYYVVLSNIYAATGKWEGVNKVRSLARERGLRKTPGWSSIEVNHRVEVFYSGNQSHPKCEEIYAELQILTSKMKSLGYIPDFSFVLQDVEEDEKVHILTSHSERLAIAFGVISTPRKSPIRIFKNLRVCGDCHNATKFISRITEREIVVRDSKRFHHFKNGICSCGDYW